MMTWLLKLLPDSWIENIARNVLGAWVAKGVTAIATLAIAHGAMNANNASQWKVTTADAVVALLMGWLSTYLTNLRHNQKQTDIATAQASSPTATLVLPPVAITTGGVGIANTDVNAGQH